MNKTIHNTLSSRGNEGSSGIEMYQQVYPELIEGLNMTISRL